MKIKKNYIALALCFLAIILCVACKKETTFLPDREISPEVSEIAEGYIEKLLKPSQGWVMAYKPDNYDSPVYIHLDFKSKDKLDILSGYRGFHEGQLDVEYYFEGKYIPIIVFDGDNVFGELAALYNGSSKFKINYDEKNNTFKLIRSDGFDNISFELLPANKELLSLVSDQIQEVLDEIAFEVEQERLLAEVKDKIKSFVEIESDFYFYNLTIGDFSAAINSFDTLSREISLTYKEKPASSPTLATVGYTLAPEGLVLNQAITFGSVSLSHIGLGDFLYHDIEKPDLPTGITITCNDEQGSMGYAHVAPYPYTDINDRTRTVAHVLHDMDLLSAGRILYSNNDDEFYSPKVLAIRETFRQVYVAKGGGTEEGTLQRFNFQIYLTGNSGPNFQLATRNLSNSANLARIFYFNEFDVSTFDKNIVKYELNAPSSVIEDQEWVEDYKNMILQVFGGSEGVTVVPVKVGSYTRFRLVNRKDSRIWVTYIHQNTTAGSPRNVNFD